MPLSNFKKVTAPAGKRLTPGSGGGSPADGRACQKSAPWIPGAHYRNITPTLKFRNVWKDRPAWRASRPFQNC